MNYKSYLFHTLKIEQHSKMVCIFATMETLFYIVVTLALTQAIQESIRRQFVTGLNASSSYRTFERFSKQQCLATCIQGSRNDMCLIAGFSNVTQTCRLSSDGHRDVQDVDRDDVGVFFMKGMHGKYLGSYEYMFKMQGWKSLIMRFAI